MIMKASWGIGPFFLGLVACSPIVSTQSSRPDPLTQVQATELVDIGQEYAATGDTVRAEQYFVAARNKGYPPMRVLPLLLDACIQGKRFDAALSYAEPVLRKAPGHWRLRALVASLHSAMKRDARAIVELSRVTREEPDKAKPHFSLALLLRENRNSKLALHHFFRYLKLAPKGEHAAEARATLALLELELKMNRDSFSNLVSEETSGKGEPKVPLTMDTPTELIDPKHMERVER